MGGLDLGGLIGRGGVFVFLGIDEVVSFKAYLLVDVVGYDVIPACQTLVELLDSFFGLLDLVVVFLLLAGVVGLDSGNFRITLRSFLSAACASRGGTRARRISWKSRGRRRR